MQISIRSLLLLLVVITLPLAGIYNRYTGKRKFAEFLSTLQVRETNVMSTVSDRPIGIVRWNYELDGWYDYTRRAPQHHGPKWIRSLFGDDALAYIKRARVLIESKEHAKTTNRLLANGDSLRGLEELHIIVEEDIEFDCQCLSGLDDVRMLVLDGIVLERKDFAAISKMNDLEVLFVTGCQFNSESVKPLADCQHLAWIQVSHSMGITKETLRIREQLPQAYVCYDSRER